MWCPMQNFSQGPILPTIFSTKDIKRLARFAYVTKYKLLVKWSVVKWNCWIIYFLLSYRVFSMVHLLQCEGLLLLNGVENIKKLICVFASELENRGGQLIWFTFSFVSSFYAIHRYIIIQSPVAKAIRKDKYPVKRARWDNSSFKISSQNNYKNSWHISLINHRTLNGRAQCIK